MTKIYISSTYEDLKEYREAVYRLLAKVPGREVHAMEDYVASDERPVDKCLTGVASCDLYVGVFAWRYGFVPPKQNPQGRSITEMEYRKAGDAGKARLIFFLDPKAPWSPEHMDAQSGRSEGSKRIAELREELGKEHTVSFFKTADQLAGLVSAAVMKWEKEQTPSVVGGATAATAPSVVQFRELRNSLLLAFSPSDEELARELAIACQAWVEKPVLLSKTALFARDEASVLALEENAIRCAGALVLLTPTCLDQLKSQAGAAAKALALLRARLASVGGVLVNLPTKDVPGSWELTPLAELVTPLAQGNALLPVSQWVQNSLPTWGTRLVGLPVSVLAMTPAEMAALEANPNVIGDELGKAAQEQYVKITKELTAAGVEWTKRYVSRREDWQPFGRTGAPISEIVSTMVGAINQRGLPKLRHRQIKVQWYPFDAVLDWEDGRDTTLRRVYQDVARAGCVLVVDELSLFHPRLRQALSNSPFSNNDRVAIVTLSPFDPGYAPINQALEAQTRMKLGGAFTRYAMDYDPQCELAVADERRLRRWLHSSLPETVVSLREPRPDQGAIRAFFDETLGPEATRPGADYPWAGGGQS